MFQVGSAVHVFRPREPSGVEAQQVVAALPEFAVGSRGGLKLRPDEVVLVGNVAVAVDVVVPHRAQLPIVAPPTQRHVGDDFLRGLGVREGISADPGAAFVGAHVAGGVERRLPLVPERRLQVVVRIHLGDVRGGLDDVNAALQGLDLLNGYRVEQVLHVLDVVGGDRVAGFHLALGVHLDGEQLIGIGAADIRDSRIGLGDERPQRGQDSGRSRALEGFFQELST